MHDVPLILTLTGGLSAALVLGYITQRLGLSPIVGYLLAGTLVGPHTPGFVADTAIAEQLAEIGVILLMFGVGLQFHIQELLAVRPGCGPRGSRAECRRNGSRCGDCARLRLGLVSGDRLRDGVGSREHRRAGAHPCGSPRPAHSRRAHRGRLACCRGPVYGRRSRPVAGVVW
jgi:hypothetical protein